MDRGAYTKTSNDVSNGMTTAWSNQRLTGQVTN